MNPVVLRIGELAAQTGVSPDTIRHYERRGVLPPAARTRAGYRVYAPDAVARVRVVRRALAIGFSLGDLAAVFGERRRGGAPCAAVRALPVERLDALDHRLAELTALRDDMRGLLRDWNQRLTHTPAGTRAHLLEHLGTRPLPGEPAGRPAAGIPPGPPRRTARVPPPSRRDHRRRR